MRIALVQQRAVPDKAENIRRGLDAMERAARSGAEVIAFAELAFEPFHPQRLQDAILVADLDRRQVASSHADRLFMRHRRPELYARWFSAS